MKKSLLALAVMGAFAGAAQAQITVYGLIDTGIASIDDGAERTTEMRSGIGAAARWGIRGSEDLGNGLKAHFVLETGFNGDDGTAPDNAAGFNRHAYLGLDGGFGTVRLGRQDTAMKDAFNKVDPFGAAGLANAQSFFLNNQTQRRGDQLTYLTPNFGGFNGGVYYNFGEERGDSSFGQTIALRAGYDNGPLHAQLVYESQSDLGGTPDNDQDEVVLGAAYNFGVATLHAAFGQRDPDVGTEYRSGMIGVSAPLGSGKVMANFIRTENNDADTEADIFALGYNYSLSKRTALIARYVRVDNELGADFRGTLNGETSNSFGVSVQHRF